MLHLEVVDALPRRRTGQSISCRGPAFVPANDQSAGKRRSTRVRYGAPSLKTTLVRAAWADVRPMACDHVLPDGVPYHDLSPEHFAPRDRAKTIRRLVRRPRNLGCEVDARHAAQRLLVSSL